MKSKFYRIVKNCLDNDIDPAKAVKDYMEEKDSRITRQEAERIAARIARQIKNRELAKIDENRHQYRDASLALHKVLTKMDIPSEHIGEAMEANFDLLAAIGNDTEADLVEDPKGGIDVLYKFIHSRK